MHKTNIDLRVIKNIWNYSVQKDDLFIAGITSVVACGASKYRLLHAATGLHYLKNFLNKTCEHRTLCFISHSQQNTPFCDYVPVRLFSFHLYLQFLGETPRQSCLLKHNILPCYSSSSCLCCSYNAQTNSGVNPQSK